MPDIGLTDNDKAILSKYSDQFTDNDRAILSQYGMNFGKVVAPEGMMPGGKSTAAWEQNSPLQKLGLIGGGAPIPKTGEENTPAEQEVSPALGLIGLPTVPGGSIKSIEAFAGDPRVAKAFSQIYGAGGDIKGLIDAGSNAASAVGSGLKTVLRHPLIRYGLISAGLGAGGYYGGRH